MSEINRRILSTLILIAIGLFSLFNDYILTLILLILFTEIYNDRLLKKYVTALIKKQWGSNLSKFAGVQLPGGVQLNGPQIYAEALQEIQIIEQEFYSQYELPIDFIVA